VLLVCFVTKNVHPETIINKYSINMQTTSSNNARALAEAGIQALRNGDAANAKRLFEQIITLGAADASAFLGLAYACRRLNDSAATTKALDNALSLEPKNLRALIFKADHLAAAGDERAAVSFYLAAVRAAAASTEPLPTDLQNEVARAQAMCEQSVVASESFLRERLTARLATQGLATESLKDPATRRFEDSLDVMFGHKKIYFQEPRQYFFPELPHIQFFARENFPWLDAVEAATDEIRAELKDVMKQANAFVPYVQGEENRPQKAQQGMLNNADWSAFYLWKNGEVVAESAARCPRTMAALANVPISQISNRSPSILFSLLRPGAHIPAHNGFINTRLICHLPLIVPDKCRFRVGNETREWIEGKAWCFDDTIEHEAWNDSDQTRVILLFEIWRPELTMRERELVNAMFEAIDARTGVKPAWEI
jgi:aspartate beta-hydroxylase